MTATNVNIKKFEVGNRGNVGRGIIEFKGNDHEVLVSRSYQDEYTVHIDNTPLETLKSLGLNYDASDIISLFKEELNVRQEKAQVKIEEAKGKEWDNSPLHELYKKLISKKELSCCKISLTDREDYIKDLFYIFINVVQTVEDKKIVNMSISTKDMYSRDRLNTKVIGFQYIAAQGIIGFKKTKKIPIMVEAIVKKVEELISKDNYNSGLTKKREKATKELSTKLGVDVIQNKKYVSKGSGSGYMDNVLEIQETDPDNVYNSRGLTLNYPDDNGSMNIKVIRGKFTVDQINKIMEIVKEAEYV